LDGRQLNVFLIGKLNTSVPNQLVAGINRGGIDERRICNGGFLCLVQNRIAQHIVGVKCVVNHQFVVVGNVLGALGKSGCVILGFSSVERGFIVEGCGIHSGNLVNGERTCHIHIASSNVFAGRNVVSSECRVPESLIAFIKGLVGIIGGIRGRCAHLKIVSILISRRIV